MNRFILFVILTLVTTTNYAQQEVPSLNDSTVNNSLSNFSCASSFRVCENVFHDFDFKLDKVDSCLPHSMFYTFQFPTSNTLGIQFTVANSTGNWEWYGPFSNLNLGICDQMNSYSLTNTTGSIGASPISISNIDEGVYILKLTLNSCVGTIEISNSGNAKFDCVETLECTECITSFSPSPGKYIVSAWVKEDNATGQTIFYDDASIQISFSGSTVTFGPFLPTGKIIDGWQRIESQIEVPTDATGINIEMIAGDESVFFDDIRFFPIDGSMISYVYDPISLRLMAELDERNYATLYEYDEEGKLIRVKKETERGIMTIQENRDNIKKQ
jgi:hypothetical protein